ncbi:ribonuclease H family protein [Clostridium sp.]|uniref:ribonuclease H family protein n=1 Tax=Clostridium sp. TaxID=1506 RepID=UPI0039969543
MAKKKYYAVAVGKSGVPMILESWSECQKEVIGAKGAIYKSFENIEDAKEFLKINSEGRVESSKTTENIKETFEGINIYVDGSFMEIKNNFSYGLVVIKDGEVIYKDKGTGNNEDSIALRNVAGEVMGAMKAVEYALNNNFKEITICYDYQGVESWALGTWKRNRELTKEYNAYMQEKMKEIKVSFKKIKGHSGNKYNDMADLLAKEALLQ